MKMLDDPICGKGKLSENGVIIFAAVSLLKRDYEHCLKNEEIRKYFYKAYETYVESKFTQEIFKKTVKCIIDKADKLEYKECKGSQFCVKSYNNICNKGGLVSSEGKFKPIQDESVQELLRMNYNSYGGMEYQNQQIPYDKAKLDAFASILNHESVLPNFSDWLRWKCDSYICKWIIDYCINMEFCHELSKLNDDDFQFRFILSHVFTLHESKEKLTNFINFFRKLIPANQKYIKAVLDDYKNSKANSPGILQLKTNINTLENELGVEYTKL